MSFDFCLIKDFQCYRYEHTRGHKYGQSSARVAVIRPRGYKTFSHVQLS